MIGLKKKSGEAADLKRNVHITLLYTLAHFLVDLACVYLVTSVVLGAPEGVWRRGWIIVLYNLVAFAGQLPVGIAADRLDRNARLAVGGCLLVALAYALHSAPYTACLLCGLGNAAFHIGGGIDVLNISGRRAVLPGIFVSSGALGVWLAYRVAGRVDIWLFPVLLVAASAALLQLDTKNRREYGVHNAPPVYGRPGALVLTGTFLLLGTVVLRSYYGMIMRFDWKSDGMLSLCFVLAVVLGKALGGLFADRFGRTKLSLCSLPTAAALFGFLFRVPAADIFAVFLFNMTMPVTLTAVAELCGGKNGFAFGLTTFALFAGLLPVFAGQTPFFSPAGLAGGCLTSCAMTVGGLLICRAKRRERDVAA